MTDNESPSFLSRVFVASGLARKNQKTIDELKHAIDSEDIDSADKLQGSIQSGIARSHINQASPYLTDKENEQYIRLKSMQVIFPKSGGFLERSLPEHLQARFDFLERKAKGPQDNQ
jgi:hypothetical protein